MSGLPKLNAPTYELTVPSTGETVPYRPYLVKEEKILMLALESNDTGQMLRAAKDVIRSCTNDQVRVDSLAMFDIEYIFAKLRSKSVGETATVSIKCDDCSASNDVDIDLETVYVDVPDSSHQTIALTDTVGITLRYPSVDVLVKEQSDQNKSEVDKIFDVIISCIDSIYSGDEIFDAREQSRNEIKDFVESLNSQQFNKVREFIDSIPSATADVNFKCVSCSKDNHLELKGLGNFFG